MQRGPYQGGDGGLVVDIEEARREFGDAVASKLKLASDGRTILWPQPSDDPNDPQNWSSSKKNFMLFIVTAAAFVPDFISSCGERKAKRTRPDRF